MSRSWRAPAGLAVLAIVLLILSGVFKDSDGFAGVLGGIGWFGFLLSVLVLIVWGIVAFRRSRRTPATR
jgi:uncharacterized protein (DUF486 family)